MATYVLRWGRAPAVVIALLLIACGSPTAQDAPPAGQAVPGTEADGELAALATEPGADRIEQLRQLAQDDGDSVLVYSSNPPQEFQVLADAFEEEYDLTVDNYRAGGTDLIERVIQEVRAGLSTADVISANDNVVSALDAGEGLASPFVSQADGELPDELKVSENSYPVYVNYWMWAYKTDLVGQHELPRTYEDLLDERWRGKITIARYTDWFAGMHQVLGAEADDYFQELAAQDPLITDEFTPALLPVISGERDLTISTTSGVLTGQQRGGAPVEGLFPEDPTVSRAQSAAWTQRGRNPAGGLLFAEFLLSPRHGQTFMRDAGRVPAHTAVKPNPPELRPEEFVPIDYEAFLPEQAEWESRFDQVFVNR